MRILLEVLATFSITSRLAACSGSQPSDLFAQTNGGKDTETAEDSGAARDLRDGMVPTDGRMEGAAPPAYSDQGSVLCGTANGSPRYCPPTFACCAHGSRQKDAISFAAYECVPDGTTCRGNYDALFACDDRNDCKTGEFCCAQVDSQGGASIYVRSVCQAGGCGGFQARLCQVGAPKGECPANAPCSPSALLPGYGVCSP